MTWLIRLGLFLSIFFMAPACDDADLGGGDTPIGEMDEDCDIEVEEGGGSCIICEGDFDGCPLGYACGGSYCHEAFCYDSGCDNPGYECRGDADADGVPETCLPPQ